MLLAGISAQTRLRLKAYRSDGGAKTHKLNGHRYIWGEKSEFQANIIKCLPY